ncbi:MULTISPECIES: signal transduction histidine kinase LytS [unclassified Anabaena]|uniref:signal transduction histidine kinase LytS n=1 Tax=unclassified Anabaena TaxID=2619674 RepID=UPI000833AC06
MVIDIRKRAVGVFSRHQDFEKALHELKNIGFPMDRVSVIARDEDGKFVSPELQMQEQVDEGVRMGVISGGVLGGLGGLLIGLGTIAIPGIGPVILAGATATAIATTLAGASIGAVTGGLLGGLISLGIPEERARVYEGRVRQGHYLMMIDGTNAEISQAEVILHRCGVEEYEIY